MNTENSPGGSYPEGRQGAQAAVEYVNNELDGVNGRPLNLESCITDASPEFSIGCANKFVQERKVAVMPHVDIGAPAAMKIYDDAGMPYVGGLPVSAEEYTVSTGFSFIGGAPAALVGVSAYVGQEMKAESVSILGPDIPQATAAVDGFVKPVLAKLGATTINTVLESPSAADFTPAMTRAYRDNPDVIIVLVAGPACTKAMQAARQVNVPVDKLVFTQECATKDQIDAGGGAGDGAVYQTPFLSPDSEDANVAVFRDKMMRYASGTPVGVASQGGFNSVMNLYAILKKLPPDDITAESLIAALKATKNEPGFMSHAYTCDGQQFPTLTALCDTNTRMLRFEDDKFIETTDQWINGVTFLR